MKQDQDNISLIVISSFSISDKVCSFMDFDSTSTILVHFHPFCFNIPRGLGNSIFMTFLKDFYGLIEVKRVHTQSFFDPCKKSLAFLTLFWI